MRRFRYSGGLGKPVQAMAIAPPRTGQWCRIAKAHKAAHPQCANCGTIVDLETDHIVPRHRGGSDSWTNLQSLCKTCHAAKTAAEAGNRAGQKFSGI